ncbi:MAG TPA: hypothetical protein VIJ79_03885 [Acidobacteriaceae bacterium]
MRPFNLILIFVLPFGLALLLAWTEGKRRAIKIWIWAGVVLIFLLGFAFAPDEGIGPATWADAADWIMPDGYVPHSVETAISVDEHWIVGETKACKSYPYIPQSASFFRKGIGYAADSLNCDDGPMHMVKATLYGRLIQPEHRIAYWKCTREPESFTCHQTGAE